MSQSPPEHNINTNVNIPLMEHFDKIMDIIQNQYANKRYLRAPEMQEIQNLAQKFKSEIINVLITETSKKECTHPSSARNETYRDPNIQQPNEYNPDKKNENIKPKETYAKIVVKSNDKFHSSSQIENSVAKVIHDNDIRATIQNSRPTNSGDIQINFNANDDVKVIANIVSEKLGIDASGRPLLMPKISISHVPHHINIDNVKEEIFKSNPFINEKKNEDLHVLFKYNRHDVQTVVCKISPSLRYEIIRNGSKIKIGCRNCPVRDRIQVTRCTKCNRLGHTKSKCSESTDTCSFCANEHTTYQCPQKDDTDKHRCINCNNSDHNSNHPSHSPKCPTYLSQKSKISQRTYWGESGPPSQ